MNPFPESCPMPIPAGQRLLLAHGEGAGLTRRLLERLIWPRLSNPILDQHGDSALLPRSDQVPVISTDSFVVSPLFFPGGDIGSLAIHGTVNDLAMSGAEPKFLTLSLIAEEGLPIEILEAVLDSTAAAVKRCQVQVVAGDTKVVPRGAVDQLFINTTGLGYRPRSVDWGWHRIQPGDQILVSGTMGDHGLAILSAREQFQFDSPIQSDSAPLHELVQSLLVSDLDIHLLRDPTRGGVAAVLHEIVEATKLAIRIEEKQLPVQPEVRGACEILGLDPIYIANEGKLILVVSARDGDRALRCLHDHPLGHKAAMIGRVEEQAMPTVWVEGIMGASRVLDEPSGAPLPRIC